ncbi:hypothetical protein [Pseudomonas defluvii]|uniref:hypothetical protein n=1 Tax=Pseudomonas defluvii TaxID=1876757 RepID=UPI0039062B19
MIRSLPIVGLALLLVSCGVGAQTPPDADQQWQQHMTEMREMHERWMASKTPEERQAMMKAHQQAMGNSMYEMGNWMGGGRMMGGMNQGAMMHQGPMMNLDSVENVDKAIAHMEQMIEQLRKHREMLSKP